MKKFAALAFLLSVQAFAQDYEKACGIFTRINDVLQEKHYQPKPIDDTLSAYVFNTVIEGLDANHQLFLKDEYESLLRHKYNIDDYLKTGNCSFFGDFVTTYRKALERSKSYIEDIAASGLSLNTTDTIYYSKQSFPYHTKGDDIKKFIRKKAVYEVFEDIAKLGKNKDSLKLQLTTLSKNATDKVIDAQLCRINMLLNPSEGFEESVYNQFFSAFCSWFDPHSTYFNYNEKASFVSSISSDNYSLGMYIGQNENNEIVVEDVVPGGPAFLSHKIDKGDQLLKIGVNNEDYEVSCASMEAITNIVFSDSYKTALLTLRKKEGTVYTVSLEKKVMKANDHTVYSYILGEAENKVGYIKIPSFYSAADENTNGVAEDVAAEVIKLKKQDINGLIIDLQFNGGGSMDEVIRMAGMFINFGPVTVVTERGKTFNTIRDYNRGMLYDGPMVVMVNGFTASASEFFAGVLQDYNRAVIVGNTTVGKATMQTILPLEQDNPTNFVKVTIDKFYRVTGKSNQYIGIVPDVELPSIYEKLMTRESAMPTAMKNDSINVNLRFSKMPPNVLHRAIAQSKKRVQEDKYLYNIQNISNRISKLYDSHKPPLPVTFDAVFADVHKMDNLWGEIAATTETEYPVMVNSSDNQENTDADTYYSAVNNYKIKTIKTDPYITESINILRDINSFMKSK